MTSSEKDVSASNETEAQKDSATVIKETESKEVSTETSEAKKAKPKKETAKKAATKKASTEKKAPKKATPKKATPKKATKKTEETAEESPAEEVAAKEVAAESTVEAPAEEPAKAEAAAEEAPAPAAEEPKAVTEPTDSEPEFKLPDFSGSVSDVVYTFEQLKASSDDYTEEEFGELVTMYENTLSRIEEKEIVKGVVLAVDPKYVIVDIGFKSEGIVPINEFPASLLETLAPGDEVEVFLDKVEDREGQLILSRKKADILLAWEKIEAAHETGEIVEGFIKRRIKGGMVVDLYGIDAFLPGSQIDVRPVRDFDAYVEKTMELQVVKLNMQAENVVVSHRSLIESDLEDKRQEILETIEKGQVLEGAVKNITDFGVFIDLGGVDGLLHITDLSHGRVDHPK